MSNAWYAHYPGDYGRDTAHLSLVQHGAYRLLLDHYYATSAALPHDVAALYRICRAFKQSEQDAIDYVVSKFFELNDDGYHNARADVEIVKRKEHHERLSTGARKTNEKRWGNRPATCPALASPQPQPHKEKRKSAAAPPADARYGPFLEFAKASFETKHKLPPTWDCFGKDGSLLARFLRRAPHVTLEVWQTHLMNFFNSTEPFTVKQGGSLAYFLSRFDTFSSGPILEGGSNEKVNSFSERRSQKAAAAISTVLGRFEKASGDIHRALPPANE